MFKKLKEKLSEIRNNLELYLTRWPDDARYRARVSIRYFTYGDHGLFRTPTENKVLYFGTYVDYLAWSRTMAKKVSAAANSKKGFIEVTVFLRKRFDREEIFIRI